MAHNKRSGDAATNRNDTLPPVRQQYAKRERTTSAVMTNEPDGVKRRVEGGNEPLYDTATRDRILAAVKDVGRVASVATVRAAVFDILDSDEPWAFYSYRESDNDKQRCDFVDAVVARIAQLQAAPHLYDESLLAKLNDAKAEYHRGCSNGWEDAMADREEMRESVEKGIR